MEILRIVGVVFGLAGVFLVLLLRFRWRRLGNLELFVGSALGLAILALGFFPNTFDALLTFFSFQRGGGARLIGLLVFSQFALYTLVFMALARGNRIERLLDQLVRELAKREFRQENDLGDALLYVIIPAYNEAENIGAVLEGIPASVLGLRTKALVVIDGATDKTEQVVKQLNKAAISYTINRGGGSALKAGYEIAFEAGAEFVVTLDADGQHLPEEIPRLVQPLVDDVADLVNGSRVLGRYEKDDQLRAAGIKFFNWMVSLLTMTRITDCSNAFRAIRASRLGELELRQNQFHTSELLIEALKKGLRVVEIPITVRKRRSGESKKGRSWSYAWGFTRAILGTWLR